MKQFLVIFLFVFTFYPAFPQLKPFPKKDQSEINKLKEGNDRFIENLMSEKDFAKRRVELVKGQSPFAIVVACSDSRVVPEYIFDKDLGEIFVIRLAGNVIDSAALGSIEYAAEHLHSSLLVILGHESCGAVKACMEANGGDAGSPNLNSIIRNIYPAVQYAGEHAKGEKAKLDTAIHQNVMNQLTWAYQNSEIIRKLYEEKELKIAGGVYSLTTGKVEFFVFEPEEKSGGDE
jgi:carbonic anhydrase